MPACVQAVRSVELLIVEWAGNVMVTRVPSAFSRTNEM